MAENLEEKNLFSGEKVKVVGPEYESGTPRAASSLEGKDPGARGDAQVSAERGTVLVQQGMVRERKAEDPGMKNTVSVSV